MGTGDGLFVYKCAQSDRRRLFIGLDANRRPLEKISEKIHRRTAKGGLHNVLFVQATVEVLPDELDEIASDVLVQFPWGSLLRGVAAGDEVVMRNLRQICGPGARLEVTIGIDHERDRHEWKRLELPRISADYINTVLDVRYRKAGFRIVAVDEFSTSQRREVKRRGRGGCRQVRDVPLSGLLHKLKLHWGFGVHASGLFQTDSTWDTTEADNADQGEAY